MRLGSMLVWWVPSKRVGEPDMPDCILGSVAALI